MGALVPKTGSTKFSESIVMLKNHGVVVKRESLMVAYLRNHRQSQAPLGPVTRPSPGVRVHHVYIMVISYRREPRAKVERANVSDL